VRAPDDGEGKHRHHRGNECGPAIDGGEVDAVVDERPDSLLGK
jgi:hypothetical protein